MTVKRQTSVTEWWTLFLLGATYSVGELGHFLLGSVSRSMAQEIHFGDKACLKSSNEYSSDICSGIEDEAMCENVTVTSKQSDTETTLTSPCEWNYNGLGLQYHILAGPAFIAIFTCSAIIWGYLADKWNRIRCLSIATFFFSIAIIGTAFSTTYWHVFCARMLLAAWESSCTPIASTLIADLFPKRNRGLAMGLFHWGIYIGYGSSFTIGNYVTAANIFDSGWRSSYIVSGLPGFAIALLLFLTGKEPDRTQDEDESLQNSKKCLNSSVMTWKESLRLGWVTIKNPMFFFLILASCVRHAAGFCWGYNSSLYFKTYYPDYDVSIWLTIISIGAGVIGVFIGGWLSDKLVQKMGISARALVLCVSQLIATPFAFAQFFVSPPTALFFLLGGYFAAEMWFGVMFALLVELVPASIRSKGVAVGLFFINNVGGTSPVLVDPIAQLLNYRTAILILYPGALFTSSILFFICWVILVTQKTNNGQKKCASSIN